MKIKDKYYKETEYLLYNYKMFEISIENMQQEIDLLKEEDGTAGISYDGIKTSPTHKFQSLVEDTALSTIELIGYLEHSIRRIENRLESIDRALEGLNETEMELVKEKYFEGKQWWKVTYAIMYSERHCRRIRRKAIQKMAVGIFGDIAIDKEDTIED